MRISNIKPYLNAFKSFQYKKPFSNSNALNFTGHNNAGYENTNTGGLYDISYNSKYQLKDFDFDEALINSNDAILATCAKGITLEYSRKDYLEDLERALSNLENDKKEEIFEKLNILPNFENEKITGYNGILTIQNLNIKNKAEKEVFDITKRFIYHNKPKTNNINLDKAVGEILASHPEFINIIGKKQSKGHTYTLDIHTLMALLECIKNPKYQKLNEDDKNLIKLTVLFHDIGKDEGIIDENHAQKSTEYFIQASNNLNISKDTKQRIEKLILNHHWLEKLNKKQWSAKEIADKFEAIKDFELAKMIAKADIIAIGNPKFLIFLDALKLEEIKEIEQILIANPSK